MEGFFSPFFNPLSSGGDSSNKSKGGGVHAEDAIRIYDGVNASFASKIDLYKNEQDLSELTWEQGYIDYTDGQTKIENNTRILSDYIDIPDEAFSIKVKTTGISGYQYDNLLYFYGVTEYIEQIGWNGDNNKVIIPSGSTRCRVILGKTNGSAITWSEITSCIATYE